MKLVNKTPHDVNVYSGSEIVATYPSAGQIRLKEKIVASRKIEDSNGVELDIVDKEYGSSELPKPVYMQFFIVSKIVRDAFPDRTDLLVPDTGPDSVVRDDNGQIIGIRRFQF